jgi:hypothetical protein
MLASGSGKEFWRTQIFPVDLHVLGCLSDPSEVSTFVLTQINVMGDALSNFQQDRKRLFRIKFKIQGTYWRGTVRFGKRRSTQIHLKTEASHVLSGGGRFRVWVVRFTLLRICGVWWGFLVKIRSLTEPSWEGSENAWHPGVMQEFCFYSIAVIRPIPKASLNLWRAMSRAREALGSWLRPLIKRWTSSIQTNVVQSSTRCSIVCPSTKPTTMQTR